MASRRRRSAGSIDEHNAITSAAATHGRSAPQVGLEFDTPKASLYVWAKLPDGVTSADYAARLIDETGVVVTPGRGYGLNGEGYIRLSVTTPDDRMEEGLRRIEAWGK